MASLSKNEEPNGSARSAAVARGTLEIRVTFYSYFRELAGCGEVVEIVPTGSPIAALLEQLMARFPRLRGMEQSILVAVGVEYQPRTYQLQPGNEVSLFPPVQGG